MAQGANWTNFPPFLKNRSGMEVEVDDNVDPRITVG